MVHSVEVGTLSQKAPLWPHSAALIVNTWLCMMFTHVQWKNTSIHRCMPDTVNKSHHHLSTPENQYSIYIYHFLFSNLYPLPILLFCSENLIPLGVFSSPDSYAHRSSPGNGRIIIAHPLQNACSEALFTRRRKPRFDAQGIHNFSITCRCSQRGHICCVFMVETGNTTCNN